MPWESAAHRATWCWASWSSGSATGCKNPALAEWLARFRADKAAAAHDYLGRRCGAASTDAFAAGADAIPDQFSPGQEGKLTPAES